MAQGRGAWSIPRSSCQPWDTFSDAVTETPPSERYHVLGTFVVGSQTHSDKSRAQLSRCSWLGVGVVEEQGKEQETLHRKSTIGALSSSHVALGSHLFWKSY